MAPCLRSGDLVELAPTDSEVLRPGEIIVVSKGESLICHRFVRRFEQEMSQWVVTKGDRVLREDPPLPAKQVIGRLAKILKPRIFDQLTWRVKRRAGRFLQHYFL